MYIEIPSKLSGPDFTTSSFHCVEGPKSRVTTAMRREERNRMSARSYSTSARHVSLQLHSPCVSAQQCRAIYGCSVRMRQVPCPSINSGLQANRSPNVSLVLRTNAAGTIYVLHSLFDYLPMLFRCNFVRPTGCPFCLAAACCWILFLLGLFVIARPNFVFVV